MKSAFIAMFAGTVACAVVQPAVVEAATWKEQVLYSFCSKPNCKDGSQSFGGLLDANGVLYGATAYGGHNAGTAFAIDPATGAETVLLKFGSVHGKLPFGDLIDVGGLLYGTTFVGGIGTETAGTVFSLDPGTGAETVVHTFHHHQADGTLPMAGLIAVDGTLYGTTTEGGSTGCNGNTCGGTLFSVDPGTGTETVLYSFCIRKYCTDGANPYYAGVVYKKGWLYGTTAYGGSAGNGTIFGFDLKKGIEKVIHLFQGGTDGVSPAAGMIEADGILYGTTGAGGKDDVGTVFSFDPDTGTETVLYAFRGGKDGAFPGAPLMELGGVLYGTTTLGGGTGCGGAGCGTVFSLDPATGAEQVIHAFIGADGAEPQGAGLVAANHRLYGTTQKGGATNNGTVFVLKQAS